MNSLGVLRTILRAIANLNRKHHSEKRTKNRTAKCLDLLATVTVELKRIFAIPQTPIAKLSVLLRICAKTTN